MALIIKCDFQGIGGPQKAPISVAVFGRFGSERYLAALAILKF